MNRTAVASGLQLAGAVAVSAGLALPFVKVAGSSRSAYGAIRSARHLEVLDGPFQSSFGVLVLLLPMLTGGLALMVGLGFGRVGTVIALTLGTLGLGIGVVGLWASSSAAPGPILVSAGGVVALLGSGLGAASLFGNRSRANRRLTG
jgi:hypothetical protein